MGCRVGPELDDEAGRLAVVEAEPVEPGAEAGERTTGNAVDRDLRAELTEHLGYGEGEPRPEGTINARNGTTPKTVVTDTGPLPLAIPRDRASSFAPQLVPKGVRRLPGFDQKVLSLYARGLTVRELQAHLEECYQVPVSPDLISAVTDEILDKCRPIAGTPEDCIAAIQEYRDAGCTHVMLELWGDDRLGQLRLFSEKVLPACR